jgi:hypothetical protein
MVSDYQNSVKSPQKQYSEVGAVIKQDSQQFKKPHQF